MEGKVRHFVPAESFDSELRFKKKLILNLSNTIHSEHTHHQLPFIEKDDEDKIPILNLLQRIIMSSVVDTIKERKDVQMYKLGKLTIKEGNVIAHGIKNDIAKDMGFDGYPSANPKSRIEIRIKATEEIRKRKLFQNKTKKRTNSSPQLDIDLSQLKH